MNKDIINIVQRIHDCINLGKGKNFLITGASSMMGLYICDTLIQLNKKDWIEDPCKIFCLVRNKAKILHIINDISIIEQDILEKIELSEQVDYIIHLVGDSKVESKINCPSDVIRTNVLGLMNVLDFVKDRKKILGMLFVSSASVYGNVGNEVLHEDAFSFCSINPTDFTNCYIESKRICETMCVAWSEQYNIPIKIARPFLVYGPNMDWSREELMPNIFNSIRAKQPIVLRSKGEGLRNFCYIEDCIVSLFYILFWGRCGEAYNVGNEQATITVRKFIRQAILILERYGIKQEVIEKKNCCTSELNYNPNFNKIKTFFEGAKVSIDEGIERILTEIGVIKKELL